MSEERKAKHTPGPLKAVKLDEWWYVMRRDGIETATIGQHSQNEEADARLYASAPELLEALKEEHRRVVSEFSGNFAGHVSIREGWVEWDEETRPEKCGICELIAKAEGGGSV